MRVLIGLILMILFTLSVSAEQIETTIISQTLVKSTNSWDGSQLLSYPEGQPEVTILKITIPAGVTLPLHQHPFINAGVLIKGELTVVNKAGKKLIMTAGDPIVELVNKWHFGENSGNVPAEIIVFYAGIKGQPITIK
ncbi:Cupin 2 conserved barrel domain protein [Colwellia psychrerythraea]|uniref:Cupin 2 conserved barrel domain protein n=2 Tax=Colwellia psychrerythraea TaxID=28229 RepID=A0A099KYC0_COLPS|nr:Cupin 2 conserved barrel domain protein [Colwellia psychrerythraea]